MIRSFGSIGSAVYLYPCDPCYPWSVRDIMNLQRIINPERRRCPMLRIPVIAISSFLVAGSGLAQPKPDKTDFAHDVLPILKANCAKCHTNGTYKGGLSMETRESLLKSKVIVPGKAAASELVKRITSTDPEERMPPKGKGLSDKEVAALKKWIDDGAAWEPGFSFKPPAYVAPLKPRRPTLPPVVNGRDHPIDRIVDAYLVANKVVRPPRLDDAAFLRRVYLDL